MLLVLAGVSGRTKYVEGLIENPCGQYGDERACCPVSVDSIGMFTLRIKLDMNLVHGELVDYGVHALLSGLCLVRCI